MDADSIPGAARADRDLLRAFVDRADGDAFAVLVARHGPLVLGVCRRVLADAPDAEDAFQATFLILARKAASVQSPERLGNWLYGVALRCSCQARKATRRVKNQPIPDLPAREAPDADWADVGPVLDAEIGQLPDKLRAALVLCELQGLDRATAAERLGVPVGTVSSRLSRAKDTLRRRLVRRGITLSLAALALILTQAARAAVPPPLARQTVRAAKRFAAGNGSGAPAAIANRVMRRPKQKVGPVAILGGLAVLALLAVVLWALFGRGPGRDRGRVADDRQAIQGSWKITASRFGAKDVPEMFGPTAVIGGGTIRFVWGDAPYQIDPTRSPKTIDLEVPFGPNERLVVCKGVYELAGDQLWIHLAQPREDRPMMVLPPGGGGQMILTLERVRD
jgi:RNA polymerase sigma factor (sigma-70 family)